MASVNRFLILAIVVVVVVQQVAAQQGGGGVFRRVFDSVSPGADMFVDGADQAASDTRSAFGRGADAAREMRDDMPNPSGSASVSSPFGSTSGTV